MKCFDVVRKIYQKVLVIKDIIGTNKWIGSDRISHMVEGLTIIDCSHICSHVKTMREKHLLGCFIPILTKKVDQNSSSARS